MTDLRQAAQQALEALDDDRYLYKYSHVIAAITALRTALAQPAQEPVAREGFEKWAKSLPNCMDLSRFKTGYSDCNTDYAWAGWQAAQRPWVGLTDEDMKDPKTHILDFIYGARWAEAKLKERNT